MSGRINNNGYDYVDLGLPSGTLWTTMNVGASKPSDYGFYFQWGDTVGYSKEQIGTGEGQKKFSSDWSDYKLGKYSNFTKYTNLGEALELEDDAAHVYMGGDWHIPTLDQFQELIDNTTSALTEMDGLFGVTFTSKKNTSKSIFFPSAGYACNGLVRRSGEYGYVWTSFLSENFHYVGYNFSFGLVKPILYCGHDYYGRSIRGAIG